MKSEEQKLLDLFEHLRPEQQDQLIAFAEFLAVRGTPADSDTREPVNLPRPAEETVTLAIRRLVRTYPMLDRRRLLGEASRFVAQHALEGRPASEVIDELEVVFARHYGRYKGVTSDE
jgi:hypothetical protein